LTLVPSTSWPHIGQRYDVLGRPKLAEPAATAFFGDFAMAKKSKERTAGQLGAVLNFS
jgi:hypothetical protein